MEDKSLTKDNNVLSVDDRGLDGGDFVNPEVDIEQKNDMKKFIQSSIFRVLNKNGSK